MDPLTLVGLRLGFESGMLRGLQKGKAMSYRTLKVFEKFIMVVVVVVACLILL